MREQKKIVETRKLTDHKWINLYNATYINGNNKPVHWIYASRKEQTKEAKEKADAVVIVPIVIQEDFSLKLCVTKEYRVPLFDYEYGFPAGLIEPNEAVEESIRRELKEETGLDLNYVKSVSPPVYSSAGMTDESVSIAIVTAYGDLSSNYTEENEDIEAFLLNDKEIKNLLNSGVKVGAKSYPYLQMAASLGMNYLWGFLRD